MPADDVKKENKEKLDAIKKHLDFIDECVVSQSFEDIPDQVNCIRDELNKLAEKKTGSK